MLFWVTVYLLEWIHSFIPVFFSHYLTVVVVCGKTMQWNLQKLKCEVLSRIVAAALQDVVVAALVVKPGEDGMVHDFGISRQLPRQLCLQLLSQQQVSCRPGGCCD